MKAEDIKEGRFYRYRQSGTIWAIARITPTHIGREHGVDRELPQAAMVVIIKDGTRIHDIPKERKLSDLADWLTCEVSAIWTNQAPAQGNVPDAAAVPTAWLDGIGGSDG